jgi:GH43 family beta-xylosidase
VNVDSDKTGEVFYLSVDAAALKSETFNNQMLVLTVEISNPSNYELAEKGTKVNVVIDVEKIRGFLK